MTAWDDRSPRRHLTHEEARDERLARNVLRPRTGQVEVQPTSQFDAAGRRLVAKQIADALALHTDPDQLRESLAALAYAHLLDTADPGVSWHKAETLGRRLWRNHGARMFTFSVVNPSDGDEAA